MAKGDITPAIYPAIPTKSTEIDNQYINDFFADKVAKGEISKEDFSKWGKRFWELKNGAQPYFITYRTEFVREFFPQLQSKKIKANPLEALWAEFK